MSADTFKGKTITVYSRGGRCIHSRNCVLARPDAFVPNAGGDWIRPDAAPAEDIAAVVRNCPSGALTYERHDGGPGEPPPPVNVVRVLENGPLAFHASLDIDGDASGYRATLCRCGQSAQKPFCDGSHRSSAFRASGEPDTQESSPLEERGGSLKVKPAANGPLIVEGPLEICTGTGRTITRTKKAALCRCGSSANKPFCDGTHARIGFKSG